MSDRLEEARNMDDMNLTSEQVDIHDWLISELEKCRTEVKRLWERDKQVEIAILATRQQRDDEFNRAEKYKIELEKCKEYIRELKEEIQDFIDRG